jgi:deferrochelatase/peroxidase EfeB
MIGRWRDGDSMARHSTSRTLKQARWRADNKFRLGEDDPSGFGCPLGAHVRRANPRESLEPGSAEQLAITNRHRILRAGRAYRGDGDERGLLFVCLNADIERQFEFIQQTWCVATQFHGIDNEADPILGRRLKSTHFTIPTPKGPIRIEGLEKFITVRGGGYFFMPSRRALKWMTHPHSSAQPKLLPHGQVKAA